MTTPFRESLITAVFMMNHHWSPAATPVDMEVAVGKDEGVATDEDADMAFSEDASMVRTRAHTFS